MVLDLEFSWVNISQSQLLNGLPSACSYVITAQYGNFALYLNVLRSGDESYAIRQASVYGCCVAIVPQTSWIIVRVVVLVSIFAFYLPFAMT